MLRRTNAVVEAISHGNKIFIGALRTLVVESHILIDTDVATL